MKHSLLLIPVMLLLICYSYSNNGLQLKAGDFIFSSLNAQKNDYFSIILLKSLPAHTSIYFSDAEWDGSKFGNDENIMHCKTGDYGTPIATEIHFTLQKNKLRRRLALLINYSK